MRVAAPAIVSGVLVTVSLAVIVCIAVAFARTKPTPSIYLPHAWLPATTNTMLLVRGDVLLAYTESFGATLTVDGVTGPARWPTAPALTFVDDACVSMWVGAGTGAFAIGSLTINVDATNVVVGSLSVSRAGASHVAWTRSSRTDRVYLDGVLAGEHTYSDVGTLAVGQIEITGALTLADVRVYDCSFTAGVIGTIYEQGRLV